MCAHTSKKFLLFSLNKFADKVCTFWQWSVATEVCKSSKIPRMLFQKACCFRCMSVPAPKSFLTLVFEDVSTFSFLLGCNLCSWMGKFETSRLVYVCGVVAVVYMRRCVCGSFVYGSCVCGVVYVAIVYVAVVYCIGGVVAAVYVELCMRSCVCGSCGVVRGRQRGSADWHSHRTGQRHPPTIYRIPLFCLFYKVWVFWSSQ